MNISVYLQWESVDCLQCSRLQQCNPPLPMKSCFAAKSTKSETSSAIAVTRTTSTFKRKWKYLIFVFPQPHVFFANSQPRAEKVIHLFEGMLSAKCCEISQVSPGCCWSCMCQTCCGCNRIKFKMTTIRCFTILIFLISSFLFKATWDFYLLTAIPPIPPIIPVNDDTWFGRFCWLWWRNNRTVMG